MKPKTKVLVIERDKNGDSVTINRFVEASVDTAKNVFGLPIPRPGKSIRVEITVKQLEQKP